MLDQISNNSKIDVSKSIEVIKQPKEKIQKNEVKELSAEDVKKFINDLNKSPLSSNNLKFGFNKENSISVIQIFDKDSDKLIRQFPTKEFFKRIEYFKNEILPGLIMDEKF